MAVLLSAIAATAQAQHFHHGHGYFGYPNTGPYFVPLAPVFRPSWPNWNGGDPFDNGQGQGGHSSGINPPAASQRRRAGILPSVPKKSANEALRRSIRLQGVGDEYFGKQNYSQAYANYKQALSVTPRRIEPRLRMAISLAATTHYSQAVDEMKRAMRMNPDWPRTGASLDELFGADNIMSKNAVLHRVTEWMRENDRDPDRLFLMGVLLHFNNEPEKSHTLFEAARALSPKSTHVQAFLDAQDKAAEDPPADPPAAPQPAPRVPQRDGQPAQPQGPIIPGLKDKPADPVPGFRGQDAPQEPRPRPLALSSFMVDVTT
jgi:hypothetical protein